MRIKISALSSKISFLKSLVFIISAILFYSLFVSNLNACEKYWTGSVSSEWSNPANWCPAEIPQGDENVTIPYTCSGNYPVINSGTYTVKSLKVNWAAALTIYGDTLIVTNLFMIKHHGTVTQYSGYVQTEKLLIQKYGVYNIYSGDLVIDKWLNNKGTLNQAGGTVWLNGSPMPVELTSFTAEVNKNKVVLKWQTATEVNNYGFDVERSPDNNNWEKVGFVQGYGNSNSPKVYTFTDASLNLNKCYYRLVQIDNDGKTEYSRIIEITGVDLEKGYELAQNFPNPFNPTTSIKYTIPSTSNVQVKVFDLLGGEVATLVNEVKDAGSHEVFFNASASGLSSGIYIYSIHAGSFVETRKMTLMK